MRRYRLQRRLIGPIYHANNVKRYEAAADAVLLRVIDQLRALGGSEVDLKEWMHIITVECLGAVSLSWSPGYLEDKSDGGSGKLAYTGWRRKSVFGLFPLAVIVEPFSKHFGRAFSVLWGVTYHIPKSKPFFPVGTPLTLPYCQGICGSCLAVLTPQIKRPCRRRPTRASDRSCGAKAGTDAATSRRT